ncbi:MAG: bifunctional 2-polyprenyl-6-hydroxyphenol methylase/3-demethylubiquinol 3-O-methyltransferase UbiG [Methylococcales bacterium]|jgi:2-polyprenyl-6-hydroxyphenyl methylase / 3-demethylubiquinone-9 3-methyltransferase|nr:bifunctional 2-polyprenyl-6-hydroxyphenol methylase/3-demethylubiquinol 3-O-methyltransferase UbiG [Methylococcales bacterium]MBT7444037.1 bifunctional 2-polyprenyl-6-hydroxyphenol methylase/3-demethylubiquinol 3-O-methyltransferase UbiG [Methylococcales bacterium]
MTDQAQNVDPQEIAKFEALASRWWDPTSEFKPLHDINPLRLGFIQEHVDLTGKTVVDVGCGGGILSEGLARSGAIVSAIDMGKAPLDVAKLHLLESNLTVDYQQTTVEDFADSHSEQFDVVTCMEMLEHVPDPESVIEACSRLVKPGGVLFFSTLNRNPKSYFFAIIGAEYVLNMLPKGTHDYQKFIKPSEMARMARSADISLMALKGMDYNPFSKTYSLTQNVDVNYMACYSK